MTVGVFGNSRGGTSAVIGIVHLLGVPIFSTRLSMDDAQLECVMAQKGGDPRDIIRQRNEEHEVWGFKSPALLKHAPILQKHLRNPHYIFVTRDPISSLSHENEIFVWNQTYFDDAKQRAQRQWDAIENTTCTFIIVSYERLVKNPKAIITQISDFLGLPYQQKAEEWVNPAKGYQYITTFYE